MRLIDSHALIKRIDCYPKAIRDAAKNAISHTPTVKDAVVVVRCKYCIHCDCSIDGMGFFYCDFDEGRTVSPNGFCDVAERRKETEDE